MEEAIGVGAAQDSELGLGLGVVRVRSDDECLVEKDFFGFAARDVVLRDVLGDVARIPVEAVVVGGIEGYGENEYMPGIYT